LCCLADIFPCNNCQVKRKIDLVYGGGSGGLMGLISQTVFNGGCHVLGYHLLSFISLRLIFAPLLAAIRKSGNDIYTCSCFVCIE
jgi:hypothetical protein